jgi:hypothetical protein
MRAVGRKVRWAFSTGNSEYEDEIMKIVMILQTSLLDEEGSRFKLGERACLPEQATVLDLTVHHAGRWLYTTSVHGPCVYTFYQPQAKCQPTSQRANFEE